MNEKNIQEALLSFVYNHKYVLFNSYVFAWESDLFSITKTGTIYEFEIKISKADFKKDFEKDKHKFFKAIADKKTHIIEPGEKSYEGSPVGREKRSFLRIYNIPWWLRPVDLEFTHEEDSFGYWMRRENYVELDFLITPGRAAATRVRIIDLSKYRIPNKFYYVCPKGLISKSEVPAYAGLLYVDGYSVTLQKQAPFIHKRTYSDMKITQVLLDKFWYLSQKLRFQLRYNNIQIDESENT